MRAPQANAIVSEVPSEILASEVRNLGPEQCFEENREFSVHIASASQIPNLLREIGRLREVTFRAVGEGTGQSLDLDWFDQHYLHVFLWNKPQHELAGAYRIGKCSIIMACLGLRGLYTSTLFRYERRFFEEIGPALELGRSFVRDEYQRQFAPLLLLWKGIAGYVARHPQTPVLFGAVSISRCYGVASRELMVRFLKERCSAPRLAQLVRPRRPFRAGYLRRWDRRAISHVLRDLDDLSDTVAKLEGDAKGIPILLKHYARLGGVFLGFNLDKSFSDAVDGLVVVDLRQTDSRMLQRYMGEKGLQDFRQYHGLASANEAYRESARRPLSVIPAVPEPALP